jgi:hypothetical protein
MLKRCGVSQAVTQQRMHSHARREQERTSTAHQARGVKVATEDGNVPMHLVKVDVKQVADLIRRQDVENLRLNLSARSQFSAQSYTVEMKHLYLALDKDPSER